MAAHRDSEHVLISDDQKLSKVDGFVHLSALKPPHEAMIEQPSNHSDSNSIDGDRIASPATQCSSQTHQQPSIWYMQIAD
jgi:hypothetical protein